MQRRLGLLMAVLLLAGGCAQAPGRKATGFAPLRRPKAKQAWPARVIWQDPGEKKAGDPSLPVIGVDLALYAGPPSQMELAGLGGSLIRIVGEEAWRKRRSLVCACMREKRLEILTAPRLSARAGQQSRFYLGREKVFLVDYDVRSSGGTMAIDPRLEKFIEGLHITLRLDRADGKVRVEEMALETSMLLGLRHCSAEVLMGERDYTVNWTEPSFLVSRNDALPLDGLTLGPGEHCVVPLRYEVIQPGSNARALARDGEVTERYESRCRDMGHPACPLSRQLTMVITARVLSPQEGKGTGPASQDSGSPPVPSSSDESPP